MADAQDLKSWDRKKSCRFESDHRHQRFELACRARTRRTSLRPRKEALHQSASGKLPISSKFFERLFCVLSNSRKRHVASVAAEVSAQSTLQVRRDALFRPAVEC